MRRNTQGVYTCRASCSTAPRRAAPHLRRLVHDDNVKLAGEARKGAAAAERQRGAHCRPGRGGVGAGAGAGALKCTHPHIVKSVCNCALHLPAPPSPPTPPPQCAPARPMARPPMAASSRICMRRRSFSQRATVCAAQHSTAQQVHNRRLSGDRWRHAGMLAALTPLPDHCHTSSHPPTHPPTHLARLPPQSVLHQRVQRHALHAVMDAQPHPHLQPGKVRHSRQPPSTTAGTDAAKPWPRG